MDLFNKAFTPDDTEELGAQKDDVDSLINSANKNRSAGLKQPISEQTQDQNHTKHTKSEVQDPTQPQIINPPDIDEEEDEEESGFENKPQS